MIYNVFYTFGRPHLTPKCIFANIYKEFTTFGRPTFVQAFILACNYNDSGTLAGNGEREDARMTGNGGASRRTWAG